MLVCFGRITCHEIYLGYSYEIKMRYAFFSQKKEKQRISQCRLIDILCSDNVKLQFNVFIVLF